MPKHGKDMVVPKTRFAPEYNPRYDFWVRMNPEYANDDWFVDLEIEDQDAELESLWLSCEPHGFNGHDPLSEEDSMSRFPSSEIDHHPDPELDHFTTRFDDDYYEQFQEDEEPHSSDEEQREEAQHVDPCEQLDPPEENLQVFTAKDVQEDEADDRAQRQLEEKAENLDNRFSHLPLLQSMRMGVRERWSEALDLCRWNTRRHYGKRYKPSRRPFTKDWYKGV